MPLYVAAASLLGLLLHATWVSGPVQKLRGLHATKEAESAEPSKGFIASVGGTTIFVFKFLRLDGVFALLALLVYSGIRNGWTLVDIATVAALVRTLSYNKLFSLNTRYVCRRTRRFWLP